MNQLLSKDQHEKQLVSYLRIIGWIVVIVTRIKVVFICLWGQVYIFHPLHL